MIRKDLFPKFIRLVVGIGMERAGDQNFDSAIFAMFPQLGSELSNTATFLFGRICIHKEALVWKRVSD